MTTESIFQTILYLVGNVITAGFLILVVARWIVAFKLYGEDTFQFSKFIFLLSPRNPRQKLTAIGGVAGLILCPINYYFGTPLPIVLALFAISLNAITVAAQPPSILFLSNSNVETAGLAEVIIPILPHRFVHFLNIDHINNCTRFNLENDCFRIQDNNWREIIRYISAVVPVIILDIRKLSPALNEEITLILSSYLIHKSIFYIGNDYHMETYLVSKGVSPSHIFTKQEDLLRILVSLKEDGFQNIAMKLNVYHSIRGRGSVFGMFR